MRSVLLAGALFGVAATSACSELSKDPAEGLSFRPPAGWTSDIRLLGTDVFASPDHSEFVSLSTMPPGAALDQRLLNGATYRNPRDTDQTDITICGDKDAQYTKAVVYFISGRRDMNLEMVTLEQQNELLDADYIYPIGTRPDKKARAAIRELCPTE
jgi:hypothetical protein